MNRLLLAVVFVIALCAGVQGVPATFGSKTVNDTASAINQATLPRANVRDTYLASSGDSVLWLHVFHGSNGGNDSVRIAIYSVNTGSNLPNNRLGAVIDFVSGPSFPTMQWDSVAVAIELTADSTYCIAIGEIDGSGNRSVYLGSDSTASTGDMHEKAATLLTVNWGIIGTDLGIAYAVYATLNYEAAAAAAGQPNVIQGPLGPGHPQAPEQPTVIQGPIKP